METANHPRLDFVVDGRNCILACPEQPMAGNPWIWRTEFYGAFPSVDLALLDRGFHVAYIDMQNMYGAPRALVHMDRFYEHLTSERGLARRCVVEGFSRGGLFAFNWVARNPEKVACLYVDAPVCDFKSWPGGRGRSKGSADNWKGLLDMYQLTEEEALTYKQNPIDNLEPLAKAGIPIIAVCGDADDVVPIEENIVIVEERYRALGGKIETIMKPGCGHHPHSLEDPTPVVDFILAYTK